MTDLEMYFLHCVQKVHGVEYHTVRMLPLTQLRMGADEAIRLLAEGMDHQLYESSGAIMPDRTWDCSRWYGPPWGLYGGQ